MCIIALKVSWQGKFFVELLILFYVEYAIHKKVRTLKFFIVISLNEGKQSQCIKEAVGYKSKLKALKISVINLVCFNETQLRYITTVDFTL